jgi:hypothetical protein
VLQHKELIQRLATEYRLAATKMQQVTPPARKLFYFSVFFGEAQRVLNFEWDRDILLIFELTNQAHAQISTALQPPLVGILSIDMAMIYEQLTKIASDLASYFEKVGDDTNRNELYQILGRLAELSYVTSGNGSYLFEKGLIKLSSPTV